MPSYKRAISMETGYFGSGYSAGAYGHYNYRNVSRKAEEIVNKFENMRTDSTESVPAPSSLSVECMQSPLPIEQPERDVQYPVPPQSPSAAAIVLQRQFSDFPLDKV